MKGEGVDDGCDGEEQTDRWIQKFRGAREFA